MRVPPHIPTSVALTHLLDEAPPDHVNLGWLIDHLEKRSFGLLILLLALISLTPGIATFAALLLAFPAVEMILGRDSPTLPRFITGRPVSTPHFARWVGRIIPLLRHMEMFIRPRWHTPVRATKRFVGLVILLLAATLIVPFPLSIVPTLVIALIAFAYLEEDGILLCISLVAALLSISFTTGTLLATIEAAGLLARK
jgi:hypothetical protein